MQVLYKRSDPTGGTDHGGERADFPGGVFESKVQATATEPIPANPEGENGPNPQPAIGLFVAEALRGKYEIHLQNSHKEAQGQIRQGTASLSVGARLRNEVLHPLLRGIQQANEDSFGKLLRSTQLQAVQDQDPEQPVSENDHEEQVIQGGRD